MSKAKVLKIALNIVKEGIKVAPGIAREIIDDLGRVITIIEVTDWISSEPEEPSVNEIFKMDRIDRIDRIDRMERDLLPHDDGSMDYGPNRRAA